LVQKSPCPCLCYTSRSACASLLCCKNCTFPTSSLVTFSIYLWDGTSLPVSLEILYTFSNILRCGILRSGYHCCHSITAAWTFPLLKPHTKCMCLLTHTALLCTNPPQLNTATLCWAAYTQESLSPSRCTAPNWVMVLNRLVDYWVSLGPNILRTRTPKVWTIRHRTSWHCLQLDVPNLRAYTVAVYL
jgi:hypothetical protein